MNRKDCFVWIPLVLVAMTFTSVSAEGTHQAASERNAITVSLSGPMTVCASPRCTEFKTGLRDDSAWKLTAAQVFSGGTYISLDWGDNQAVRDKIFSYRLPSSLSDTRMPVAKVTGRMTFQRLGVIQDMLKKDGGDIRVPCGADNDTLIPVLEIESLTVELGDQLIQLRELHEMLRFEIRVFVAGTGTEIG